MGLTFLWHSFLLPICVVSIHKLHDTMRYTFQSPYKARTFQLTWSGIKTDGFSFRFYWSCEVTSSGPNISSTDNFRSSCHLQSSDNSLLVLDKVIGECLVLGITLYFLSQDIWGHLCLVCFKCECYWLPGFSRHPRVYSFAPLITATFCWDLLCSFLGQETLFEAAKWKGKNNSPKSMWVWI